MLPLRTICTTKKREIEREISNVVIEPDGRDTTYFNQITHIMFFWGEKKEEKER